MSKSDMSSFTGQQFLHFSYLYRQYDRLPVHSTFSKHSDDACHVGCGTTEKKEKEYEIPPWNLLHSDDSAALHACLHSSR